MEKEQALRYNDGKLQWSLVDFPSLEPMVKVLEFGAKKYSPNNWKKGLPIDKIAESLLRHTFALLNGEINDPESGLPHIGHIQCNAMFIAFMLDKQKYKEFMEDFNKHNPPEHAITSADFDRLRGAMLSNYPAK